jgi:hypothetical protein
MVFDDGLRICPASNMSLVTQGHDDDSEKEGIPMRMIALSVTLPLVMALAACGPFAGGSGDQEKATVTVENKGGAAPTAPAAAPPAAAADAAPAAAGGKDAAAAAPATQMSGGSAVTDTKGGSPGGGNACTDGQNRNVMVVNDTGTTLRELYGSNVNRTTWEEDVLGADVLAAGAQVNVNWDDGTCMCRFDLKAVFSDGTETVRRNFDVCRESAWRIVE